MAVSQQDVCVWGGGGGGGGGRGTERDNVCMTMFYVICTAYTTSNNYVVLYSTFFVYQDCFSGVNLKNLYQTSLYGYMYMLHHLYTGNFIKLSSMI